MGSSTLSVFIGLPLLLAIAFRIYKVKSWGYAKNKHNMHNKVVVITGANCGLGFETAKSLSECGAIVILACRDVYKSQKAINSIKKDFPKAQLHTMELDLGSFQSIINFSKQVQIEFPVIDVLINNAGVAMPIINDKKTKEGYEIHFGVNHLGHFLLTNLLLECLKKAEKARIIIVSSSLMKRGKIDFDDINLVNKIQKFKKIGKVTTKPDSGYANSKLMNLYFGRGLAERTKHLGIDVFTLCPGFCYSNLFRHYFKWYHIFLAPLFFLNMKSTKQGAQTTIYCATNPDIEGISGAFFMNCKLSNLLIEYDKSVEDHLWLLSEEYTRVKYQF